MLGGMARLPSFATAVPGNVITQTRPRIVQVARLKMPEFDRQSGNCQAALGKAG
jgi:hypothetical protein